MSVTFRMFVDGVKPVQAATALSRSNLETLIVPGDHDRLMVLSPDFEVPVEDSEELVESIAGGLSQMIATPVLAMIELPGNSLDFVLFQAGDETDRYAFRSETSETDRGGSASHLAEAFGRSQATLAIEQAFRAPSEDPSEIVAGLSRALGFPDWWAGLTYRQLDRHLTDGDAPWTERACLRTP